MRKIILFIASSLDGYIARENGDIDWLPENTASGYDNFIKSVDTVIMGKTTYDQILTFGEYPYKDKKSFVFTRNYNQSNDKNTKFVFDVKKFVNQGFPDAGKNIWLVGGAEIISSFLKQGAIDEIIISVIPVLLGNGIPLFNNIENETKLEFVKTANHDQLVDLYYKVLK